MANFNDVKDRVIECYVMRIKGHTYTDIMTTISEKYEITTRQAENYIQKSNNLLEEVKRNLNIEVEFGVAYERLNIIFEKQIKIQDYKGALATQKEISELVGIKARTLLDLTTNGKELEPFTIQVIDPETVDEIEKLKS